MPQHVPCRPLSSHDRGVKLGPQPVQNIPIHGDANTFTLRQGPLQRQFHVFQDLCCRLGLELRPQLPGQFHDRSSIQHGRCSRGSLVNLEQGFLGIDSCIRHQIAAQIPLHQGSKVLSPDVRP